MDEDLITEIMVDQGLTPEQAAYVAATIRGEMIETAQAWDSAVWEAWRAQLQAVTGIAVPWELAARLTGAVAA